MEVTDTRDLPLSKLRVAIVHYWFVGRAGGERVVEAIAELFPQADLFSLVAEEHALAPVLRGRKLQTSFLQKLPGAKRFHRHFFPLQPIALEQFDLTGYDLVISSESGPAKGVLTSSRTCHICYCHSPMRYIWEMYPQYIKTMNPLVRAIYFLTAHYMRIWDHASSARVDYFVANSRFVASRIWKYYRRPSAVIHPPVDTEDGGIERPAGDHYLAVGRMVDYKRFDLAVKACTELNRPLRVVGSGPQFKMLKKIAGPSVQFLGRLDDAALHKELASCKALLFPGEEDFGIVPVEAQSFGRPVIAYASGGALETVRASPPGGVTIPNATGVFFASQTTESLKTAILEFEATEHQFSSAAIRQHSLQFAKDRFKTEFAAFVSSCLGEFERSFSHPTVEEPVKPS